MAPLRLHDTFLLEDSARLFFSAYHHQPMISTTHALITMIYETFENYHMYTILHMYPQIIHEAFFTDTYG
jgi:hypothetical protein